ncbi:hypothetical protein F5148DRAFT_1181528, partial [Russula earlei]
MSQACLWPPLCFSHASLLPSILAADSVIAAITYPPNLTMGNLCLSQRVDVSHLSFPQLLKCFCTMCATLLWCVQGHMSEREWGCWTSKWTSTKGPEVRERKGESLYHVWQTDERGEGKDSYSKLFYYRVAKCFMYRDEEQRKG